MGKHLFEGEEVTARKIKRRGVVYNEKQIQSALDAGCRTMKDLVAHIEREHAESRRKTNRQGAKAMGKIQYG